MWPNLFLIKEWWNTNEHAPPKDNHSLVELQHPCAKN
jgi:hypothetical protein